jgi:hypothetical protein
MLSLRVLYGKRSTKEIYTDPLPAGEVDRYINKYLQQQLQFNIQLPLTNTDTTT